MNAKIEKNHSSSVCFGASVGQENLSGVENERHAI